MDDSSNDDTENQLEKKPLESDGFCGENDPEKSICLNRPIGKGKLIEKDCLNKDYTPADGLNQMLAYLRDKKPNPKNSTILTANCYTPDLGWFVVIQDIINQLDVEIDNKKEPELIGTPESTVSDENDPIIQEILKNKLEELEKETKKMNEVLDKINPPKINLIELFEQIIIYGREKWNIDESEFKEKCETENCTYLTAHSGDKDLCIGFLILRFFQDLIILPGFIVFSECILNREKIPNLNIQTNESTDAKFNEADALNTIKKVFKMALFIMNPINDLSNFYNGMDTTNVFKTIQTEFKLIESLFSLCSFKSDIKGGSLVSELGTMIKDSSWSERLKPFNILGWSLWAACVTVTTIISGAFSIKNYFANTSEVANALKNFAKLQIKSNPDFYVFKNGFVFYKKIHNAVIKDYYKLNYYGKIEGEITENTKTVVLCVERYDVSKSWKPYIKKTKDAVIPYTYMKGDENIKKSFKNDEVRKKNNKFIEGAQEGERMQEAEDDNSGYIQVNEGTAEGGMKRRSKKHKRKPKKYTKKRKFTKRRKIVRKKTKKRY
jgi:hypothetical protein